MNPRRIVFRLPNWLGDGVMAVAAIRALRRRFPDAEVILHGKAPFESLLGDSGLFERFLPRRGGRGAAAENAAALRALDIDVAVLLPHSFRSAWEAWRAGIPVRIGYAREGRGPLLTHALPPHRSGAAIAPVPMHHQYLELVALLGATGTPEDGNLGFGEEARVAADAWLARHGIGPGERPLGVNPGASFGSSKIYPSDLLATAIEQARHEGLGPVLILCGPGEEELARDIAGRLEGDVACAADEPPPLDVLKAILARCSATITTDAGPRHVATALGVPTVVLMGPTDPRFTNARLERTALLRRDVPCGPCHEKICPIDHRCMRMIPPGEVVDAVRSLLATV